MNEDKLVSAPDACHNVANSTAEFTKVRGRRRNIARTTATAFGPPNPFAVLNSQAAKNSSARDRYVVRHATLHSRNKHEGTKKYQRQCNMKKLMLYCRLARVCQNLSIPPPQTVWVPSEAQAHCVTPKQPEGVNAKCGETHQASSLESSACTGSSPRSAHSSTQSLCTEGTHPQHQVESDTKKSDRDELPVLESPSST